MELCRDHGKEKGSYLLVPLEGVILGLYRDTEKRDSKGVQGLYTDYREYIGAI